MTQADPPLCLLTRPRAEAERFAARVKETLGLESLIAPLLRIESREVEVSWTDYSALILSSARAAERLTSLGVPPGMLCFCVGARTAQTARNAGMDGRVAGQNADELVAHVASEAPPGRLLHLHGEHTRGDIVGRLATAGVDCREIIVYQQLAQDLPSDLIARSQAGLHLLAPVFSPRTATLLARSELDWPHVTLVAMSANVAQALADLPAPEIAVARLPNEAAILEAMTDTMVVRGLLEGRSVQR
ncbi:MAG: uroporphyrinogen-III synthase [Pseudomonadota bacterium]